MAGMLAALGLFVAFTTGFGLFVFLPELFASYRADLNARRPAYNWIAHNAPLSANVFAYDDPLLFLYTGRKSCNLPVPPTLYYHDDQAGIDKLLASIPDFAREYELGYVLLTRDDFYRDLHERGARGLRQAVELNGAFQQRYKSPAVAVYQFKSVGATRASLRPGL
jgi:hypothetical protein